MLTSWYLQDLVSSNKYPQQITASDEMCRQCNVMVCTGKTTSKGTQQSFPELHIYRLTLNITFIAKKLQIEHNHIIIILPLEAFNAKEHRMARTLGKIVDERVKTIRITKKSLLSSFKFLLLYIIHWIINNKIWSACLMSKVFLVQNSIELYS